MAQGSSLVPANLPRTTQRPADTLRKHSLHHVPVPTLVPIPGGRQAAAATLLPRQHRLRTPCDRYTHLLGHTDPQGFIIQGNTVTGQADPAKLSRHTRDTTMHIRTHNRQLAARCTMAVSSCTCVRACTCVRVRPSRPSYTYPIIHPTRHDTCTVGTRHIRYCSVVQAYIPSIRRRDRSNETSIHHSVQQQYT